MKQLLIIIFITILLSACYRRNLPDSCVNIACTNEYRMITAAVVDSNLLPFVPQKIETILDGEIVNISTSPIQVLENSWLLYGDELKDKLGVNIDNTIIVKTYHNNTIVSIDTLTAKADCCHVQKINGKDTIKVNL
ncbi:MAG: hypothetical protein IT215_01220 [Chitinophagaceae bacterium]|nr:MAG: hypothetical protein UZ11_BCD004001393 [Bacteroidetes bacterium OLB11]MCC6447290.1 hypothetical protein [Chitinophagaceae bacterium]HMN33728.1 hypothetical protein [Chitinophagaceae bacterium]